MILRPFYMCAVLSAIAVLASAQTEKQLEDTHDEKSVLESLLNIHENIGDDKDAQRIFIKDQNSNDTLQFRVKRRNRHGSRPGGTQSSIGDGSRSIYAKPPPRNGNRSAITNPRPNKQTNGKIPATARPPKRTTPATPPPRKGGTTTPPPRNGKTSTTSRPNSIKTSTTFRPKHDSHENDDDYHQPSPDNGDETEPPQNNDHHQPSPDGRNDDGDGTEPLQNNDHHQPSPDGQNDNGDGTEPPQSIDYEQTSSDNQNNDDSQDSNDGQDQSDGSTNYLADDSLSIPEALIRDPLVVKEQARHYFQQAFIGAPYWPDGAIEHIMSALSYRGEMNLCVQNAYANCEETGQRYIREYRESGENCWKKYGAKSGNNEDYSKQYLNQHNKCNNETEEVGEEYLRGYKNCLENYRLDTC